MRNTHWRSRVERVEQFECEIRLIREKRLERNFGKRQGEEDESGIE